MTAATTDVRPAAPAPADPGAAAVPDTSRQAVTRRRLLEAAACEFARRGFHAATVRDICKRADANVAAVSYHFGDKEGLYAATLAHLIAAGLAQYPPLMGVPADAPAADRLGGFVRGVLRRMLDPGASGYHGQLMAREMVEPTACLDAVIRDTIRPMTDLLHGIVRDLAGPAAAEADVRRCGMSVIGQCCFYRHARELVTRMFGHDLYTEAGLEATADHVTRFALAGIAACVGAGTAAAPAR